ncbi:cell growth regulator with EF hand domain protein 1 [Engraulis encrasicolus]|uniref:cell growth regulator with EF hand domain protein 1 n=1 Tax=Engraulis encrasicolus TaxID=184585 RepID=UPI002FD66303
MFAAALVPLLFAPLLTQGAPQQGQEPERSVSAVVNPFGSADESRSLLQSYIKASLNDQGNLEVSTRDQEVFFLFSLHDYDKSGQLDGLELMRLLEDFLSHHSQAHTSTDGVVAMVDYLLQTQDQNQDGLLAPSELLSAPVSDSFPAAIESNAAADGQANKEPPQEEASEGGAAQKAESDGPADTANDQKEAQEETQQQDGQEQQQLGEEVRAEQGQEAVEQDGENRDAVGGGIQDTEQEEGTHHQPEAEAAGEHQQQAESHTGDGQNQNHPPPVHQGQPEM